MATVDVRGSIRTYTGDGNLVEEGYYTLNREFFRDGTRLYNMFSRRNKRIVFGGVPSEVVPPAFTAQPMIFHSF